MVFGVGPRAGEALVAHPDVPLISFTGSTAVGSHIQAVSAPFIKHLSLEVCSTVGVHVLWGGGRHVLWGVMFMCCILARREECWDSVC